MYPTERPATVTQNVAAVGAGALSPLDNHRGHTALGGHPPVRRVTNLRPGRC